MGLAVAMTMLSFPRLCRSMVFGALVVLLQGDYAWARTHQVKLDPALVPVSGLLDATALFNFDAPLKPSQDYLPTAPAAKVTHLVLRLNEKRVYVFADDQVLDQFPVAVGAPDTPTPTGEFEIFQMVVDPLWQSPWTGEVYPPGPNSALGLRWIGFATLDNGIIGFHGTPTVSSIGQAVSNGCVRLRNEDVLALYAHARMGMKVIVEP